MKPKEGTILTVARVVVSRAARSDLLGIRDYIAVELSNPDAAARVLAEREGNPSET